MHTRYLDIHTLCSSVTSHNDQRSRYRSSLIIMAATGSSDHVACIFFPELDFLVWTMTSIVIGMTCWHSLGQTSYEGEGSVAELIHDM